MKRLPLLAQIFPTLLLVTLAALVSVTWYVSAEMAAFHARQTRLELENRAHLILPQVEQLLARGGEELQAFCDEVGLASGTRITVVRRDGRVLCDSDENPARMDNHGTRPEVQQALAGGVGSATRYSNTRRQEMLYVALPFPTQAAPTGVVRTALPANPLRATLDALHQRILLASFGVALVLGLLSYLLARLIARPLEEMRRGAIRFSRGRFDRPLPLRGAAEVVGLGEALNRMALQLDERIRTVVEQRNEQEGVLASMVEGVLAVDVNEKILRLNRAAARLLGVSAREAEGRQLQAILRKPDLQRFVARALAADEPVEGDLTLRVEGEERALQAHGTRLRDADGQQLGALIVLNDVTRLRRLESIRRDFVANVSHELKTPITAIKGAAETLADGALGDPAGASRFVAIIAKQAERLNAIIDDLLALSRIEQDAEKEGVNLRLAPVRPVLEAALQTCAAAAQAKQLELRLNCAPELQARINPPLLEQAVINLLTNAIKYSESGGRVLVDAAQLQQRVMIKVQDWGCGIPAEHLPRVFERFYRVDKARSRELGGTGLGLAIVKHIVQAHQGEVSVQSAPGAGSSFTLILPAGASSSAPDHALTQS